MSDIYFCHVRLESPVPFQTEIDGSVVQPEGIENFVDCDCPPSSAPPAGSHCDSCSHPTSEHYPKDSVTPTLALRNHDR